LTGLDLVRTVRAIGEQLEQRHRVEHTLRVARLAGRLAAAHGLDPQAARLAGLLHDLARLWPAERLLAECAARGMRVDAFERVNPIVLHARLGAELARERFGINDESVLSAIRKHTVAAATMSPLDAVVYLADGLEPGRRFPERAEFVELALHDLDAAMRAVLTSSIRYLVGRGLAVAPQTFAAARTYGLDAPEEEKRPA
jgi:predicted HD superfamily hydrolase involved in NAD metabolism